ncbi:MAG: AAA family ATPase, partial [Syntrophaceae bacterium]|nr:AAA family ATPase [Syntrophaceae bacterium]
LLAEKNIKLDIADEALEHLAKLGFNPLMGARPLKRVIQTRIQDPLADDIIEGKIQPENTVIIKVEDENFILETENAK